MRDKNRSFIERRYSQQQHKKISKEASASQFKSMRNIYKQYKTKNLTQG